MYQCSDYLSPEFQMGQQRASLAREPGLSSSSPSSDSTSSSSSTGVINDVWREKICEWCYQVVDHFEFNREIVSIAMSYLDRYLVTRQVTKKIFQLAAMTCLYLAIKLYESRKLRISSLIELSRGYFSPEHINAMEESILRSLKWQMHPPTSLCFARHFILLLPNDCSSSVKHEIMELSRFLTELSVCDYFFVTRNPSSAALAAILTSMETLPKNRLSFRTKNEFLSAIANVANIQYDAEEVTECRERLKEMYNRGGYNCHSQTEKIIDYPAQDRGPSPDSVAAFKDHESHPTNYNTHSYQPDSTHQKRKPSHESRTYYYNESQNQDLSSSSAEDHTTNKAARYY